MEQLKKELEEYSEYKRFFFASNGIVCPIAPIKAEDINKPLYFERCIDGIVSTFPVAKNSAGLKDGGKFFLLGKYLLLQGNSGQMSYATWNNIYNDLHRYPKVLNYHHPVPPGEYFVKFGNYGLTTDFKQLSPKENGIRLTFADSKDSKASLKKQKISETLQKFLIAVQIPDYSKQEKADYTDYNNAKTEADNLVNKAHKAGLVAHTAAILGNIFTADFTYTVISYKEVTLCRSVYVIERVCAVSTGVICVTLLCAGSRYNCSYKTVVQCHNL